MKPSELAKTRILAQDRAHPENTALINAFSEIFDELHESLQKIKNLYSIKNSITPEQLGNKVLAKRPENVTESQYRALIQSKIIKNTSQCTIMDIEEFMASLVSSVRVEVIDNQDMTFELKFIGKLTDAERELIKDFDFIPRPAGVRFANSSETGLTARAGKSFVRSGDIRSGQGVFEQ